MICDSRDRSRTWLVALVVVAVAVLSRPAAAEVHTGADRHALLTAVLADHVIQGRVDYAALRDDERLARYLDQLRATQPDTIADPADRLALWINAYNAYTLQVVAENYPIESINDLHFGGLIVGLALNKTVWDREFVEIGGEVLTLDQVEHEIIRKRFDEPRIHFAVVCAARSCPRLRSEAYEGWKLEAQLEDQAVEFFTEPLKNWFDREEKVAYLSKILDWYAGDFGDDETAILLHVTRWLPADLAEAIRHDAREWRVEHTKYFWELNGTAPAAGGDGG